MTVVSVSTVMLPGCIIYEEAPVEVQLSLAVPPQIIEAGDADSVTVGLIFTVTLAGSETPPGPLAIIV